MNGLDAVEAIAIDLGCPAKRDAPMREYTSFRTGGPADLLVEPQEEGQLAQILRCCNAALCFAWCRGFICCTSRMV